MNITRRRPAVRVALPVPRRREHVLLLRRHGRARRHDGHAGHHGRRRHPLMVDPQAGRQDGRGPGLHEQDLVQDPADAIPAGEKQVVYTGQCAELCGRNHANMLGRVIGMRYDDYKAWYDRKARRSRPPRPGRQAPASRSTSSSQGGRPEDPQTHGHDHHRPPSRPTCASARAPQIIAHDASPSARAGRRGSRPPITRRSGSCTSYTSSCSSCWAGSRRC